MRRLIRSRSLISISFLAWAAWPTGALGMTPVRTKVGDQYRVVNSSRFKGWAETALPDEKPSPAGSKTPPPPKELNRTEFSGSSKVVFRERQLPSAPPADGTRLFRAYDIVEYARNLGEQEEKARLRQQVRRVLLDPMEKGFVIYSPDGPMRLAELSMLADHSHLPLLETFLPEKELKVGDTWPADSKALVELTGLDSVESGSVECKYEGEVTIQDIPYAQISATGSFIGITGGQRSRCNLRAGLYLDAKTNRFVSMRAVGKQETLGPEDKVLGEVQVDFQVLIEPADNDKELNDQVVTKLPTQATPDLLRLVFELPEKGFRLVHGRQWILQRVDGDRFFFAGPNVSFVVTLEPEDKVPTVESYRDQVAHYMKDQKIETKPSQPPETKEIDGLSLSHFQYQAKIKDRPSLLDYWVLSMGNRGLTIASNAADPAPEGVLADLSAMIARIELFDPITPEEPPADRLANPSAKGEPESK
ncbi:hypothetical protein K2X85_06685 [bacterium]|nr:hypothetical protein [bacterium]